MTSKSIGLPNDVYDYVLAHGVREPEILARLREETASHPMAQMQIEPLQGAIFRLLVELLDARSYVEVGTFTGYSSLAVALAMPPDGRLVCCDVSEEYTNVARRYWTEAGVADRVDLRIGPGVDGLDSLLAEGRASTFDLAFIDADKKSYPDYYERIVQLLRPGGLVALDNVLWGGEISDPTKTDRDTLALRAVNERVRDDERVTQVLLPVADGMTLARKR
jgi:predicted O-methyltransferase YrrM